MQRIPGTAGILAAVCALLCAANANADGIAQLRTFKVNDTADAVDAHPGDGVCNANTNPISPPRCTLRAAVMEGNTYGDGWTVEVQLQPGATYKLVIPGSNEQQSVSGDLDILRPMRIGVPSGSAYKATIDGTGKGRLFHFIDTPGTSLLYGVHLIGGEVESSDGAAIYSTAERLILNSLDIEDNAKTLGTNGVVFIEVGSLSLQKTRIHHNGMRNNQGMPGVAVYARALMADGSDAELIIENSTIDHNAGDAVSVIRGAFLQANNSTFTQNFDKEILVVSSFADLSSVTIAGSDSPPFSKGVVMGDYYGAAAVKMQNSIVKAEQGGSCAGNDTGIQFATKNNIYGDLSCGSDTPIDNSLHNTDAQLSEFGYWGGPTPTYKPLAGSPAIDRAPAELCDDLGTDQRGYLRPTTYEGNGAPRCDTGAVELRPKGVQQEPEEPGDPEEPLDTPIFADGFED